LEIEIGGEGVVVRGLNNGKHSFKPLTPEGEHISFLNLKSYKFKIAFYLNPDFSFI
jgi:hypothetical protein